MAKIISAGFSHEERLDYERRILWAEVGTQRILNDFRKRLQWAHEHARFTPDVLDPKAAEVLGNIIKWVDEIDVTAGPANDQSRDFGSEARSLLQREVCYELDWPSIEQDCSVLAKEAIAAIVAAISKHGEPKGFSLIADNELTRLREIDAKHGWKERPPPAPSVHHFKPNRKWPWFCELCGYAPHEPLQHIRPPILPSSESPTL